MIKNNKKRKLAGENTISDTVEHSNTKIKDSTESDSTFVDMYSMNNSKENKFYETLLNSPCEKDNKIFSEIARRENFNYLKEGLRLKEHHSRKDHEYCVYRTFLLFSSGQFAEEDYSLEVLKWLVDEQEIEKIIQKESQVKMIHLLTKQNNLCAVKWAFAEYYKPSDLGNIFETRDEYEKDIFNYAVDGVAVMQESCSDEESWEVFELITQKYKEKLLAEGKNSREIKELVEKEISLSRDYYFY